MTGVAERVRRAVAVADERARSAAAAEAAFAAALAAAREELRAATDDEVRVRAASEALVAFAEVRRAEVRQRVERVVESALRAVFGDHMRFRFDVRVLRNAASMSPEVGYDRGAGGCSWRSVDEVGGGVVDVLAFVLRVMVLGMLGDAVAPIVFADEPFRHVSARHRPAVARMLSEVSRATGIQLIVVSHEPQVADAADCLIRVSRGPDGRSTTESWGDERETADGEE